MSAGGGDAAGDGQGSGAAARISPRYAWRRPRRFRRRRPTISAGWRALSVHVSITQRIPRRRQSQGCLLRLPGNVAYHVYSATHERTTQTSRHHHTSHQGSRPPHRPGRVRGRCQPGGSGTGREHPQRAHRRGKSSASSASPRPLGRTRSPSRWPSSPTPSGPGIRCHHPAGKRAMPAVVRGLIKVVCRS